MTGETYMRKLEERVLELARMGISYFKFDGLFGHLNVRDFDIPDNPFPSSNNERLNDSRYDESKGYYLSAGTERLMQILGNWEPSIRTYSSPSQTEPTLVLGGCNTWISYG